MNKQYPNEFSKQEIIEEINTSYLKLNSSALSEGEKKTTFDLYRTWTTSNSNFKWRIKSSTITKHIKQQSKDIQ